MDCYPQTLQRAVEKINEMILMEDPEAVSVKCGDCVKCEMKATLDSLRKRLGA